MLRRRVDVIIPAYNEEALLPSCLRGLLWQASDADLRVVAVANGCTDDTTPILRSFQPKFAERGVNLEVIELAEANKSLALNEGLLNSRESVAVVFLDSDTSLLPGTVKALADDLYSHDQPRMASPKPVGVRPRSWLARGFVAVWRELPAVQGVPIGAGCFAVNVSGRLRIGTFPNLVADDAYVRSRFSSEERGIAGADGGFLLRYPEGRELISVARRWRRGNRELDEFDRGTNPSAGLAANLRTIFLQPRLWGSIPAFAFITIAARVTSVHTTRWESARELRNREASNGAETRPVVDVVIVTYNSADHIGECLERTTAGLADLNVTVVDNDSRDGTADLIDGPRLVRNSSNVGFGVAVNEVVGKGTAEYILLLNPDARLEPTSIDQLIATAYLTGAQLLGGRSHHEDGTLDYSCCLAAPNLWHALAFGLGLSSLPAIDPDALGGWKRDDVRAVPVLTGSLLLITRELWNALGGFDPSFFVYGEDADLCLRASQMGVAPTFAPTARYVHVGGASSDNVTRLVLILTGKATLYRKHLPPVRRRLACAALLSGVYLRGAAERLLGRDARWGEVWRRREEWEHGWGDRVPVPHTDRD